MRFYQTSVAVLTAACLTPSGIAANVSTSLRGNDEKAEPVRKLQGDKPFTVEGCTETFLAMPKIYRDSFSHQIYSWVEMDLIEDGSLNTAKLETMIANEDESRFPDFHKLAFPVRGAFVMESCPYFFAEVARRFDISQGTAMINLRFCLDPNAHKRCPAKLYMPTDKVIEYGQDKVVAAMCEAVEESWDEIKTDLMFRYENQEFIRSNNRAQGIPASEHRFNKITFKPENLPANVKPIPVMTSDLYPITQATYDVIRFSTAVSPILEGDRNVMTDLGDLAKLSRDVMDGPPVHPEDEEFWPYLRHMITLQKHRRAHGSDKCSTIFEVPDLWAEHSIDKCAENVHDEYPVAWQIAYLTDQLGKKALKVDPRIIPQRAGTDFVNSVVSFSHISAWSANVIAATSFAMKWHEGRMRPEEAVWKIKEGKMNNLIDSIPQDIIDDIASMDLKSAPEFTAYPEGCPGHPSWPAMHSVGSTLSMWLPVVCNLTPEQVKQARLTDHAVAYARSVAGVHYFDDNIAGLSLGQAIVAQALPEFLEREFGANFQAVEEKVKAQRFDWFEFAPELLANPTGAQ